MRIAVELYNRTGMFVCHFVPFHPSHSDSDVNLMLSEYSSVMFKRNFKKIMRK